MEYKDYLMMTDEEQEKWVDSDESKQFKIDSDKLADWAIQTIKKEEEKSKSFCDIIDEKIEALKEQKEKEKTQLNYRTAFLTTRLNEYLDKSKMTKTTKTAKTLKLPSGTFKRKLEKDVFATLSGVLFNKDRDLIKYCEEFAPDFVEIEKKVKWGDFKKNLEISDGDVIDKNRTLIDEETGEIKPAIVPCMIVEKSIPTTEVK